MENVDYLDGEIVFESPRLIGRRWLRSDLDTIFEVYSDPSVVKWIGDGSVITLAQAEAWLDITDSNYRRYGYGMFTLLIRESGHIAGFVGLVHPGERVHAEIKYAFRNAYWGKGLASEIVSTVVDYAAKKIDLEIITATAAPANVASHKVLLKAGFSMIEERLDEDGIAETYFELYT